MKKVFSVPGTFQNAIATEHLSYKLAPKIRVKNHIKSLFNKRGNLFLKQLLFLTEL